MPLFTFEDISDQYEALGITQELASKFVERTDKHIQRVIANAKRVEKAFPGRFRGLSLQVKDHDKSKYAPPEFAPYVWLTEYHRCKDKNIPFEYPEGMKEKVDEATLYHIQNNSHHAEYFDPEKEDIELGKNRDSLAEMSDATEMDELSLVEMVCDWAAMSQEKGTSLKEWADKNVNKRWEFSKDQVALIDELVEFFKPDMREGVEGFGGFDDPWKVMNPEDRKEASRLFRAAMKAFPSSPKQLMLHAKLNAILAKYGIGKTVKRESFHRRLDKILREEFESSRENYNPDSAMSEDVADWMARCFNVGPKAKPIQRKTRTCPKCGGPNAYTHEAHADTGFDEMVLRCPDCRKDSAL